MLQPQRWLAMKLLAVAITAVVVVVLVIAPAAAATTRTIAITPAAHTMAVAAVHNTTAAAVDI